MECSQDELIELMGDKVEELVEKVESKDAQDFSVTIALALSTKFRETTTLHNSNPVIWLTHQSRRSLS